MQNDRIGRISALKDDLSGHFLLEGRLFIDEE